MIGCSGLDGEVGCTNICCQFCVSEAVCRYCYRLYGDKPGCPCLQDQKDTPDCCPSVSNSTSSDSLSQQELGDNKPSSLPASPPSSTPSAPPAPGRVPRCRPSCCPRADCTKRSCPECYRRMVRSPALCPCVDTGHYSEKIYKNAQTPGSKLLK